MPKFIKATPRTISAEIGGYQVINSDYIVSIVRADVTRTTIKMCAGGEIFDFEVCEKPDELLKAINE